MYLAKLSAALVATALSIGANLVILHTASAQFGTGRPTVLDAAEDGPAPTRDLTGVWTRVYPDRAFRSGATYTEEPPKLTPWGEERSSQNKNSNAGGYTLAETNDPVLTKCYPPGVPRVYFHPYPFEFVHTPKDTLMIFEYDHTIRRIYTDGREHPGPDVLVPLWLGHSVGRWRDDSTFVVDTVGFDERTWLDRSGIPHSEKLHVVEIFRRIDLRNMEIDITMEDPIALAEPWVAETLHYRLAPPTWELGEISCSGDYLDFSSFEDFTQN